MKAQRRQRLLLIGFLVAGVTVAVGLGLFALNENINLFYEPETIVAGDAPVDQRIRAGGMVLDGSVERDPDSLKVFFAISDLAGHDVPVEYTGILPDLFREGQGVVATGRLRADGTFVASEVLAKHDETYMPPELEGMAERAAAQRAAAEREAAPAPSAPSMSRGGGG